MQIYVLSHVGRILKKNNRLSARSKKLIASIVFLRLIKSLDNCIKSTGGKIDAFFERYWKNNATEKLMINCTNFIYDFIYKKKLLNKHSYKTADCS